MKRTNKKGNSIITISDIRTPEDLTQFLLSFSVVENVRILDGLETSLQMVVIVQLTDWYSFMYLISSEFRGRIMSLLETSVSRIPEEITVSTIVEL